MRLEKNYGCWSFILSSLLTTNLASLNLARKASLDLQSFWLGWAGRVPCACSNRSSCHTLALSPRDHTPRPRPRRRPARHSKPLAHQTFSWSCKQRHSARLAPLQNVPLAWVNKHHGIAALVVIPFQIAAPVHSYVYAYAHTPRLRWSYSFTADKHKERFREACT